MIELPVFILRIGIGLTFFLTGVLILSSNDKWVHMLPGWFLRLVKSPRAFMIGTAIGDIAIGLWLMSGYFAGIGAVIASLHLLGVLVVSGKHEFHEVYRDIGLLMASMALALLLLG